MPEAMIARLIADEERLKTLTDALSEHFDPEEFAASAFEIVDENALPTSFIRPSSSAIKLGKEGAMGVVLPAADAAWMGEFFFPEGWDEAEIRALVALYDEEGAKELVVEVLSGQDWVKTALEGLAPVKAGRFMVHGAHDRENIPPNALGIEIEAALAFGTGHHGTTLGCLLHLDELLKKQRFRHIVDIGAGSGVLAFAAAKALRREVKAGEMDADSVRISYANARLNALAPFVRPVKARGLHHPLLRRKGHYDLLMANILARPLKALAREIAIAAAPRAHLILSGLLMGDRAAILAQYRAFGFHLVAQKHIEGWVSLHLARK